MNNPSKDVSVPSKKNDIGLSAGEKKRSTPENLPAVGPKYVARVCPYFSKRGTVASLDFCYRKSSYTDGFQLGRLLFLDNAHSI